MSKRDPKTTGLTCNVFRENRHLFNQDVDCTNGGISSKCDTVTLVDIGVPLFEPSPESPAVRIVRRNLGGEVYLHAVPVEQPAGLVGPMFGGNFIYTSDSRFPSSYPIALHDRWETQEQYNHLSR